jgi:hypothetical protein
MSTFTKMRTSTTTWVIAYFTLFAVIVLLLTSCSSSKCNHCDAYGQTYSTTSQDTASK